MKTFRVGDRVTMVSACVDMNGDTTRTRKLYGTVEAWGRDRLLVAWEDWPCVTALPNPNVEHA